MNKRDQEKYLQGHHFVLHTRSQYRNEWLKKEHYHFMVYFVDEKEITP
jgi:hypothetical protein